MKITVAGDRFDALEGRVHFFASIDMWTGIATVAAQIFLTGRLMSRFGVGVTLAVLPLVTLLGFACLALGFRFPELLDVAMVIIVFEALRRASNYAVSRPAREVLYTVVPRREKYRAKNAIDTFVYRTGDQVGIIAFAQLIKPLGPALTCVLTVPLAVGWLMLALWLGLVQRRRAAHEGSMKDSSILASAG